MQIAIMLLQWINGLCWSFYVWADNISWFAGISLLHWFEILLFSGVVYRFLVKWFETKGYKKMTGKMKEFDKRRGIR